MKQLTPAQKKGIFNIIMVLIGLANVWFAVVKTMIAEGRAVQVTHENTLLKHYRDSVVRENARLERTVNEVVVKVVTDNYDINDIPLPMGYKIYDKVNKTLVMVRTNESYNSTYNTGNISYFGREDSVIHKRYGAEYFPNDLKVMAGPARKVWTFYENAINNKGQHIIGKFRKWKLIKEDNQYLYFLQTE